MLGKTYNEPEGKKATIISDKIIVVLFLKILQSYIFGRKADTFVLALFAKSNLI